MDTRLGIRGTGASSGRSFYQHFEPVGPGTLAGRYLRQFWQPVYRSDDLAPGKTKPLVLLGEEFTLFRTATGRAQVVEARCPHRGTRLWTGSVEGEGLRCFYHGWKFAASGECLEQPAEDPRVARRICIRSYPTREYIGLIFAFLGEGAPPAFPVLEVFEQAAYRDVDAVRRNCSFFNQIENSVDEVHINFVHRVSGFAEAGYTARIPVMVTRETAYGIERISERRNEARIGHFLMPNVLLTTVPDPDNGWTQHISWRVPVDDKSHISFMVDAIDLSGAKLQAYLGRRAADRAKLETLPPAEEIAAAILRGEVTLESVSDRPDLLTIQDSVALAGQAGAQRERDRLGRSDSSVAQLRRIWARELRALSENRPTKIWEWPRDIRVRVVARPSNLALEHAQ